MFNAKNKTPLYFEKVTLRRTKDGAKIAKLRLAIPLEADIAMHCPPEVKAAYEAIETRDNKISYAEIDGVIGGVNIEFYSLPTGKSVSLALNSVQLEKLAVEREDSRSKVETKLMVTIEILVDEKDKLRHWLIDNVFNQLWANFEVAQMALMPSVGQETRPVVQ